MLAVVTGGAGHLGVNLVRFLVEEGQTVRAVDRRRSAAWPAPVEFVPADVLDPATLPGALAGADVVYHLAARISIAGDPDGGVWRVNVDGVRHVAEAALAAGVHRLVHTSSVHAFDAAQGRDGIDETTPRALGGHLPVYDRSKAAGEAELRRVVDRGLDAVVVHPTAIVGPADPEPSRMGRVLRAAFRGLLPAVVAGAFDWVDVRDVAAALAAAAQQGRTGESYLVGGSFCGVADLVGLAASVAGRRPPRLVLPDGLARLGAAAASRLPSGRSGPLFTPEALGALRAGRPVRTDKARRELGHEPRPLAATLRDLLDYFDGAGPEQRAERPGRWPRG